MVPRASTSTAGMGFPLRDPVRGIVRREYCAGKAHFCSGGRLRSELVERRSDPQSLLVVCEDERLTAGAASTRSARVKCGTMLTARGLPTLLLNHAISGSFGGDVIARIVECEVYPARFVAGLVVWVLGELRSEIERSALYLLEPTRCSRRAPQHRLRPNPDETPTFC